MAKLGHYNRLREVNILKRNSHLRNRHCQLPSFNLSPALHSTLKSSKSQKIISIWCFKTLLPSEHLSSLPTFHGKGSKALKSNLLAFSPRLLWIIEYFNILEIINKYICIIFTVHVQFLMEVYDTKLD